MVLYALVMLGVGTGRTDRVTKLTLLNLVNRKLPTIVVPIL